MPKCPSCRAPCEVEISPPYTAQWLEEDKVQTEFHLGSCKYIYSPEKRKATIDELITYQELKEHLAELEDTYRRNFASHKFSQTAVRAQWRIKNSIEHSIKLLEKFLDFTI